MQSFYKREVNKTSNYNTSPHVNRQLKNSPRFDKISSVGNQIARVLDAAMGIVRELLII